MYYIETIQKAVMFMVFSLFSANKSSLIQIYTILVDNSVH